MDSLDKQNSIRIHLAEISQTLYNAMKIIEDLRQELDEEN